jgi:hypothetical protein
MSDERNINVTEENFTFGDVEKWELTLVKSVGKRSISHYKAKAVNYFHGY